ncbi:hypothetical protein [Variovorax sp. PAMC26660]|uniref:hypothetical protein n=1 Tax=Variovorax sp. PAMC26660 TaxID=2762322 RepID=UPI0021C30F03|nr:hypothetical protein [Variovorax sp. PAMC26660]
MKSRFLAIVLGVTLCGAAMAQPIGGFYLFKNKESGKEVCSSHAFSPDWIKQAGPFEDLTCKIAQKPQPARTDLPASPLDLAPRK